MKTTFKNQLAFVMAGLLFAGCAATHSGSSCCDGAGASAKCDMSGMKRVEYEYKAVKVEGNVTNFVAQLNEAAKGGWKLYQTSTLAPDTYLFERVKQ